MLLFTNFTPSTFIERSDNVEVQRVADGTWLLGAIKHAHPTRRSGQEPGQLGSRERTIKADLDQADLLASPVHLLNGFLGGANS